MNDVVVWEFSLYSCKPSVMLEEPDRGAGDTYRKDVERNRGNFERLPKEKEQRHGVGTRESRAVAQGGSGRESAGSGEGSRELRALDVKERAATVG